MLLTIVKLQITILVVQKCILLLSAQRSNLNYFVSAVRSFMLAHIVLKNKFSLMLPTFGFLTKTQLRVHGKEYLVVLPNVLKCFDCYNQRKKCCDIGYFESANISSLILAIT